MRVLYADPGLRDKADRHASAGRAIRAELERRGIEANVLSHSAIVPELQAELNAVPLFRAYTYFQTDGDPVSGWLNAFDKSARATEEDLRRMRGMTADDIVYLHVAQPPQLLALVKWAQSLPPENRLHCVLQLGNDPGVDVQAGSETGKFTLVARDYRYDPRAMFYRFAASHVTEQDLARCHMMTFDAGASQVYATLLARPVGVLPMLQSAPAVIAGRVGRRPVTVAVLGRQRADKGYHLMPQIARLLLAHEPDVRLLIHNNAPDALAQVQQELRAHASVESRVTLHEEAAGPAAWADLLDRSDLILCPYEPARFVAGYSAVAAEAVANAIPVVVPGATALSRMLDSFGNPGTVFDRYDPVSIVTATRRALADFDAVAGRAVIAAQQWRARMGVRSMVDALLACASGGAATPSPAA